jgi:hypothetical protein
MEEFVMSDASFEPSPEMVERVAEALYLTAVRSAQERIAARPMPTEKIKAVFEDALAASDREAAIIIFALIDDIATEFFRERLTGKVPNGVEQAFLTGNGLLASGYNKILLLAGREWIRIETYRELNLIRRVRNEFAHHVEYRAFGDSPIRDYIESMDQSDLYQVSESVTRWGIPGSERLIRNSGIARTGISQSFERPTPRFEDSR